MLGELFGHRIRSYVCPARGKLAAGLELQAQRPAELGTEPDHHLGYCRSPLAPSHLAARVSAI
jgi:hypothetical protein